MDTLTDVLNHIRSSGALLGRTLANPPWSAVFDEQASLSLVSMLRGEAWILDGAQVHALRPRDIAVVVGPEPFEVTSDPDARPAPMYVHTSTGICFDDTLDPAEALALDVRTCGTRLDADDTMLTGSYTVTGRIADRLLSALPRVLVVPHRTQRTAALDLLESEVLRDEPGQQAILDRLLDLALAGTLRDWFALPDAEAPGWYAATSDPVVGVALAAIHDTPERPWTIELLAQKAHVSRPTLARRFTELLGEPPMSYLTSWRLCMAADLLTRGDSTVEAVAHDVGYSSAYALSTAFHREYGVRPGQYRRTLNAVG
ncbi:MAG TPA: AraC family transcriptional regulator [Candidatus Nesterenkonia stercoripullorum]|uniref:AraC family transcriptional regulator n=1 Tax=Candidatus Nesterenkonia stercoripullorum TaxID=2838701 RepID=A0A9D1S0X4_9MICC|nr:AraC family transcriptional regulator [Candidatus Nesterenkonia stercoripullorum]